MYVIAERLALPILGLIWMAGILIMAWFSFRSPAQLRRLQSKTIALPPRNEMRPQGPISAAQRTALSRRRKLSR
jgi:hypothetical protein